MIVAAAGPTAYWYLTRGTGTIALILLTISVGLGVANVRRARTAGVPRFVFEAVHRNASLLGVAFIVVHIVTSLLDGYAPINLLDAVIPFGSAYRPLWLGFGAVAFDLLLAVAVTSLLRRRLGYKRWKATHWAAYASWPVAVLHGLGTGSDTKAAWMLMVLAGCLIVVIVAVVARVAAGWPDHMGARLTALGASAAVPISLLVWLPSGPLAAGWAQRAGTPGSLLARAATGSTQTRAGSSAARAGGNTSSAAGAFTANVSGSVRQGPLANGLFGVNITLAVSGQHLSALAIRLQGQPTGNGGVEMSSSDVSLGTSSNPGLYHGRVVALQGATVEARVHDATGHHLQLIAQLQLDPGSGSASGTLSATPVRGGDGE